MAELPDIGDSSQTLISPREEKQLGQAFMQSVRQQVTLTSDQDINDYLHKLGQRLANASDNPTSKFTFFMVEDTSINAFAGPGGYIGINTGLMLLARNESELAGVLAHEIAHVTQRHLYRGFEAADRLSLPTVAATIAALLLGAATDPSAGIAAASAIQAGNIQYQINFTRSNEKEADRVGIAILSKAGFDPQGMPDFFQQLQKVNQLYGVAIPEFLSTHPLTLDRIAEAQDRASTIRFTGTDRLPIFELMQVRLRVLSSRTPEKSARFYNAEVAKNPESTRLKYAQSLANYRSNRIEQAISQMRKLLKNSPDNILFRTTLANYYSQSGQHSQAIKLLKNSHRLYVGNTNITTHYAKILLKAGQTDKALKLLHTLMADNRHHSIDLYSLLAETAEASGRSWEARQATAEKYYLQGQTRAAIQQLKSALMSTKLDRITQTRIETRLKELKTESLAKHKF